MAVLVCNEETDDGYTSQVSLPSKLFLQDVLVLIKASIHTIDLSSLAHPKFFTDQPDQTLIMGYQNHTTLTEKETSSYHSALAKSFASIKSQLCWIPSSSSMSTGPYDLITKQHFMTCHDMWKLNAEPSRSHSYFERVECFCKGFDRLHVQMVCRFIQNVKVGAVKWESETR